MVSYSVLISFFFLFCFGAVAANSARDIGGRLMAMTIWGRQASGGKYAAIAALTNILSMVLGAVIYEIFFTDSDRVLPPSQLEFLYGHKAHEHRRGQAYDETHPVVATGVSTASHYSDSEKQQVSQTA